jgi:hypothetical protein
MRWLVLASAALLLTTAAGCYVAGKCDCVVGPQCDYCYQVPHSQSGYAPMPFVPEKPMPKADQK